MNGPPNAVPAGWRRPRNRSSSCHQVAGFVVYWLLDINVTSPHGTTQQLARPTRFNPASTHRFTTIRAASVHLSDLVSPRTGAVPPLNCA
jgi:hypothetical protein